MSFVHSKDFVTDLDDKCIQPNAVDLRLDYVEELWTDTQQWMSSWCNPVVISEGPKEFIRRERAERRRFIQRSPIPASAIGSTPVPEITQSDVSDGFLIKGKRSYDLVTKHRVKVPEGIVGWCHIRSTLSRNGIILSGGLYDAGYDGVIGFTIHNLTTNDILLEDNVRVAQFIMATSETFHLYDGHYNQNGGYSK
jgi:deoxycytidine triphosphate deaminase